MTTQKTMLIADDDRDLVQVLKTRCEQLGVDVLCAYDAMTALNTIHQRRPDLVCLDINMPAGNGLSICEMLQADEKLASTSVIMLTGRADEETIRRCHTMCAYYVLKSSDVWNRMEPIVRELLEMPPLHDDTVGGVDSDLPSHATSGGVSRLCELLVQERTAQEDG